MDGVNQFDKMCRICLTENRWLTSIFECQTRDCEISLDKKIMACATIELCEGDGLPSNICKKCLNSLNTSFQFRMQCEKADRTLHQLIADTNQDVADNIEKESVTNIGTMELEEEDKEASAEVKAEPEDDDIAVHEFVETSLKPEQKDKAGKRPYVRRRAAKSKEHTCEQCGGKFDSRRALVKHSWTYHGVHIKRKTHSCIVCGETFTKWSELCKHKKDLAHHSRETCDLCNKSFASRYMMDHLRNHTGEKPYLCNQCGRSFSQISTFYKHRKLCSNVEKKLKCAFCERRYHERYRLTEHERIHTNEKPYVCETCGKAFRRKGKLLVHQLSHTDVKPHACTTCGRCFRQRSHLIEHMRVHSGIKPFTCDMCGATFTQGHSLKTHRAKHNELMVARPLTIPGGLTIQLQPHKTCDAQC